MASLPNAVGLTRPRRKRRTVVPIDLGGSPTACAVRPPLRPPPSPETVAALVEHYRVERRPGPDSNLEVAFFHGGVPDAALVEAAAPYPLRLACSPTDLPRETVEWLVRHGLETVEVEVLTFQSEVLRACRRGYGRSEALSMLRGLKELGLRVGAVLSPGLPGSSHAAALDDARLVAGLDPAGVRADFVRLQPALALDGSQLQPLAESGRWIPMDLGQAVTTVAACLDIFDQAGVAVARVGLQPGADLPVQAVAGPVHPNLRALAESRRFRARMGRVLEGRSLGGSVVLRVHPKDLSWAKGTANENIRALRAQHRLRALELETDATIPRGRVLLGA